jgi:asparagine synthase (glutamine-hydrolysing)
MIMNDAGEFNTATSIRVQLGTKPIWYQISFGDESNPQLATVYSRGHLWFQGRWYQDHTFCQLICDQIKNANGDQLFEQIKSFLANLNGFYSFIVILDNKALLVVDRGRSIPLFYSNTAKNIIISDDGFTIQENMPEPVYDEVAIAELLILGVVTGAHTLNPDISQVNAGSMVMFDLHQPLAIKNCIYYVYEHDDANEYEEGALAGEYRSTLAQATERFIQSLNGKRLALSLSGGYDSRLLAVLLKEADFKNVFFYTYGAEDNWEVIYGRGIAKKLGYPWVHIPYSYNRWRRVGAQPEYKEFLFYGCKLVSYPFMQDWLAIQEMLKNGNLQKGDVIMPGHSGDFISGNFLPMNLKSVETSDLKSIADVIFSNRYVTWIATSQHEDIRQKLFANLLSELEKLPNRSRDRGSLFESWASHVRLPRLIVNHMRVYEYFECDWRMLLWDTEIFQFWSRVPFEQRLGQKFYISELDKMFTAHGIEGFIPRKLIPVTMLQRFMNQAVDRINSPYMGRFSIGEVVRSWDLYRKTFGLSTHNSMFRMYSENNTAYGDLILRLLSGHKPKGK